MKPTKRKNASPACSPSRAEKSKEIHDTDKCPEGMPQEIWDDVLERADAYIAEWKEAVQEHVAEYDRTMAAKKAKKKAAAKRSKSCL